MIEREGQPQTQQRHESLRHKAAGRWLHLKQGGVCRMDVQIFIRFGTVGIGGVEVKEWRGLLRLL